MSTATEHGKGKGSGSKSTVVTGKGKGIPGKTMGKPAVVLPSATAGPSMQTTDSAERAAEPNPALDTHTSKHVGHEAEPDTRLYAGANQVAYKRETTDGHALTGLTYQQMREQIRKDRLDNPLWVKWGGYSRPRSSVPSPTSSEDEEDVSQSFAHQGGLFDFSKPPTGKHIEEFINILEILGFQRFCDYIDTHDLNVQFSTLKKTGDNEESWKEALAKVDPEAYASLESEEKINTSIRTDDFSGTDPETDGYQQRNPHGFLWKNIAANQGRCTCK